MNLEQELSRFKILLLRKMPFYGDIIMNVPFVENKNIETAATNGRSIEYNPKFFGSLSEGERNFVIMHELFHIILRHSARNTDSKRDHKIWNTACDLLVNQMLAGMIRTFNSMGIIFDKPQVGLFSYVPESETAENLYKTIEADNDGLNVFSQKVKIRSNYGWDNSTVTVKIPSDLIIVKNAKADGDDQGGAVKINEIRQIISEAARKYRGDTGSYYIPQQVFCLENSRKLNWKTLLRDFLTQEIGDDASYSTPERKYLHMDLILPGHSLTEEKVEEIWAFVDSSGSIGQNEMGQFLTQIYRISKEFKCIFNICYWDTRVTDVYKKILKEDDILKCLPKHSGGTDINCVYDWLAATKVKPDIMLILTDGYFGPLNTPAFRPSLGKKSILVLSSNIGVNDDMKRIGKIAKL